MLSPRAWATLGALVCLLGLATAATATDGEATLQPLRASEDVPAGTPVTMGWVLTDDDGQPAFHQNARFEVTHEGRTLLATTPASGHDYDGVDPYQVAFPGPGNYTVTATIPDGEDVHELTYEGNVTEGGQAPLELAIQAPDEATTGQRVDLSATARTPEGEPVEDVEITLRLQRSLDRFEVLKTRLAGESPTLGYAFARSGSFELVAVASPLPGGDAAGLAAASTTHTIDVEASPAPSPIDVPVERPLVNDVETGERSEDGLELFATYDPYTSVGPHGRLRLGMLTLDEDTHAPEPDVSYQISILDPDDRQILHSSDVHAADGFEYVTLSRPDPGTYEARIDATKGDWQDHTVAEFTVVPPVGATNAGPLFATPNATTSLDAGVPAEFPIYVEDAAGVPLLHGEVDVRLLDERDVPIATGKLHVHENGTHPITLAAHEAGAHRLQLLPQSLQPAPTPYTFGEQPGQAPTFDVDVAPAEADEVLEGQGGTDRDEALGPGLLGVASALLAAALFTARRPR